MKNLRFGILLLLLFILLATALPIVGANLYRRFLHKDEPETVSVYFHENNEYKSLHRDEYLLGVTLNVIDRKYSEETLNAAVIALRSACYYLKGACREGCGADADYCTCKFSLSYCDNEEYLQKHGSDGQKYIDSILHAIEETKGKYLLYENSYALALVHRSSYMTTQSAYEALGREYPYLESVITPEKAEISENYVLDIDLKRKLALYLNTAHSEDISPSLTLSRTGRVSSVSLYSCEISSEIFMDIFDLRSDFFEIEEAYGGIVIRTYGVGHGLGLSLAGAEKMVENGFYCTDVLSYYFRGCKIIDENESKI